eukprot:4703519-Prymnesium_polylepis.2
MAFASASRAWPAPFGVSGVAVTSPATATWRMSSAPRSASLSQPSAAAAASSAPPSSTTATSPRAANVTLPRISTQATTRHTPSAASADTPKSWSARRAAPKERPSGVSTVATSPPLCR